MEDLVHAPSPSGLAMWQTIESAPKGIGRGKGPRIDLAGRKHGEWRRAPDCYWHQGRGRWMTRWRDGDGYSALDFEPSHWMPRPAPPSSDEPLNAARETARETNSSNEGRSS